MTDRDWPPHEPHTRHWRQTVPRGPRSDRQVREITVLMPPRIRDLDYPAEREIAAMCTASAGDLTHLDLVHGRTLQPLNELLLRTEVIDSSKIEDIDLGFGDYSRALLGRGARPSAQAMASSTAAMSRLVVAVDENREVRVDAILRGHYELFRRHPDEHHRAGTVRTTQNWVGGSDYAPTGTLHVPPPPETVPDYLDDLVAFANREDLPSVAQAAIVHAQFECIHPFIDGNGRIGRALIHAVLRRRRITKHLTVPIASALVAHRDLYFAGLDSYKAGHAAPMIAMLARAVQTATAEAWQTARTLREIRDRWQDAAGDPRPGSTLFRLLDLLDEDPIINVERVVAAFGVAEAEARAEIDRLDRAGVLWRARGFRRNNVWLAHDILHEVQALAERIQAISRLPGHVPS